MARLVVISLFHLVRSPVRRAALYPWLLLTLEDWARARYHLTLPDLGALRYLGLGLIALGVLTCLIAMVQFILDGQGTPEPFAPPKAVVTSGIFGVSRNPMYVGMLAILFGESIAFSSPLTLLLAAASLWQFRRWASREEARLPPRFGEAYVRYCQEVPRWLPGLPGAGRSETPGAAPRIVQ